MVEDIQGRQANLEPYGVVFTKIWAREREVNPVWYMDATPGRDWLANHVGALMQRAIESGQGTEIFRLTPFFDVMGTWNRFNRNEFWWERGWRKVGDVHFSWHDMVAVLAPEEQHGHLRDSLENELGKQNLFGDLSELKFLDPKWGLERMIGSLSGISPRYLGSLPTPPKR